VTLEQEGGSEKKQASLCSDNVVGVEKGWYSREIKLKESKSEEGHVALE
jgi:hypothetical protein